MPPLLALVLLLPTLFVLAGCTGGNSSVSMGDLADMTADTMGDLLLGPPPDPTGMAPPDPPLLKKGGKETVIVAADTAAFVGISKGAIPESALKQTLKDIVRMLNRRMEKRGFHATASPDFPPVNPSDEKTLVTTLAPVTEEAGSPSDKAQGKQRTMILVRLTVTDPATGTILRQRDYYSGKDVQRAGTPSPTPTP